MTKLPHTEILSPRLEWGPEAVRDHHLTRKQHNNTYKFDPRCPRCVSDWTEGKVKVKATRG